MEGLGDSFMNVTLEAWRKVPPGSEHGRGEQGVHRNEHPRRRAVVEQLLKPVLDEAAAIRRLASANTQPHFERGERTNEAEPGLGDDDSYGRDMSDAKPSVVHPAPMLEIADDGKRQPCDDECSDANVYNQHGVREQQAERAIEKHKLPNVRHERHDPACRGMSARWRG